jgi:hypothetical protein
MALNKIKLIYFYTINYKKHNNFRNKLGKIMLLLITFTKNLMFITRQRYKIFVVNKLNSNILDINSININVLIISNT